MNKASMIQDICTKIGCGYLETMYRMTTQQVTWLWMNIYKFEHNTRKEVIEFAKKSFNDDQFPENTDRDSGFGRYRGFRDDSLEIIERARENSPEIMSNRKVLNKFWFGSIISK